MLFGGDCFIGDDVEFVEGYDEKFLEVGDSLNMRVGMVWVGRVVDGSKIFVYEIDEYVVIGDLKKGFVIDFEYS